METDESALSSALEELEAALLRKSQQLRKCNKLLQARRHVRARLTSQERKPQRGNRQPSRSPEVAQDGAAAEGRAGYSQEDIPSAHPASEGAQREQNSHGGDFRSCCNSLKTGGPQSDSREIGSRKFNPACVRAFFSGDGSPDSFQTHEPHCYQTNFNEPKPSACLANVNACTREPLSRVDDDHHSLHEANDDISASDQLSPVVCTKRKTSTVALDVVLPVVDTSPQNQKISLRGSPLNITETSGIDCQSPGSVGVAIESVNNLKINDTVKLSQHLSLEVEIPVLAEENKCEPHENKELYLKKICNPKTEELIAVSKDGTSQSEISLISFSCQPELEGSHASPVLISNEPSKVRREDSNLTRKKVLTETMSSISQYCSNDSGSSYEKFREKKYDVSISKASKCDDCITEWGSVNKPTIKKNVTFREGSPDIFFVSQVSHTEGMSTDEVTVVEETEESSTEDEELPSTCPRTEVLSRNFNLSPNNSFEGVNECGRNSKRSLGETFKEQNFDECSEAVKNENKPSEKRIKLNEELELHTSEPRENCENIEETEFAKQNIQLRNAEDLLGDEDKENLINSSPIVSSNVDSSVFLEQVSLSPIVCEDVSCQKVKTKKIQTRVLQNSDEEQNFQDQNSNSLINSNAEMRKGVHIEKQAAFLSEIKTNNCGFTSCNSSENILKVPLDASRALDGGSSSHTPRWRHLQEGSERLKVVRCCVQAGAVHDSRLHVLVVHTKGLVVWTCDPSRSQWTRMAVCERPPLDDTSSEKLLVSSLPLDGPDLLASDQTSASCCPHCSVPLASTDHCCTAASSHPDLKMRANCNELELSSSSLTPSASTRVACISRCFPTACSDVSIATSTAKAAATASTPTVLIPTAVRAAPIPSAQTLSTTIAACAPTVPKSIAATFTSKRAASTPTAPTSTATAAESTPTLQESTSTGVAFTPTTPASTSTAALCRFVVLRPTEEAGRWRIALVEAHPCVPGCQMYTLDAELQLPGVLHDYDAMCCGVGSWTLALALRSSPPEEWNVSVLELEDVYRRRLRRHELLCEVRHLRTTVEPSLRHLLPLTPSLSGAGGHGIVVGHHEAGLLLLDTKFDVLLKDIRWNTTSSPRLSPKPTSPFPGSPSFLHEFSKSEVECDQLGGERGSPFLEDPSHEKILSSQRLSLAQQNADTDNAVDSGTVNRTDLNYADVSIHFADKPAEPFCQLEIDTIVLVIFDCDTLQWVCSDRQGRLLLCCCDNIVWRPKFELKQIALHGWNVWPRVRVGPAATELSQGSLCDAALTHGSLFLLTDNAWVASLALTSEQMNFRSSSKQCAQLKDCP